LAPVRAQQAAAPAGQPPPGQPAVAAAPQPLQPTGTLPVCGGMYQIGPPAKLPPTTLKAVVTYCDRRGVSYMLPFGRMRVNDRDHWIVQMSGRDHEWYAVVEAAADRVKYVAEFQAGWVPLPR